MLLQLEQRLHEKGLRLRVEPLIWNGDHLGIVYCIFEDTECASLVLTHDIEYRIHDVEQRVIHIRDLFVKEEYRHRGIARLLLFYALCHAIEQSPEIRYSDLEDDTDFPWDEPGNLYYAFGYRFKEGDLQEKWLDLKEFKRDRDTLFLSCILK